MRKTTCKNINLNYVHHHDIYFKLKAHQNALFRRYSKLLMLRMDFAYLKTSKAYHHTDIHDTVSDMVLLLQQGRVISGLVGYAWVLEYTEEHGWHIHAAFYLNGQKHRKTWNMFGRINDIWNKITDGEGYTHWCSPKEYYDVQGERVTCWNDKAGRNDMRYILSYLSKQAQKTERLICQCSDIPPRNKSGGRRRNIG